jgi:2-polyprenyl-3-methyl-5-hydroxy-6-metoxy-1,4-benzoquinol methylase
MKKIRPEPARKGGWFTIPGRQVGDRTLEQQMKGLSPLVSEIAGKVVVDLGCAEGLIGNALLGHGAKQVYGAEIVQGHVEVANTLHQHMHVTQMDLNDTSRVAQFMNSICLYGPADAVLMMAVLHKLRQPLSLVEAVLLHKPRLVVVRTAERTPGYVQDPRSGDQRFEFRPMFMAAGYVLETQTHGSFKEWMGYFRRRI